MKKLPVLLTLLLLYFYSCKKKDERHLIFTSSDYQIGDSLARINNDSAFYYFNRSVSNSKDSLQIAMAYNRMAVMQLNAGDYFSSQETLLSSFKHLNEQNERDYSCLSSNYNLLGRNSQYLKNYDAALNYYDLAIKFNKDDQRNSIFLNNKAVTYQKKQEYDKAINIYTQILEKSKGIAIDYARVLSNLTRTRWLADSDYHAVPNLLTAMKIREKENDNWGLNASYSHLSDYYSNSKPDSGLLYAQKMYEVAQKLNSPLDQLEALEKLINLSPTNQKNYFIRFKHLNDSIQDSRNAAKNQLSLIRYEMEKNKSDNLQLQRDNLKQRIVKNSIVLAFVVIGFAAIAWHRKRKRKIEWKSRNAIRENQFKTSKKVHDVVANGLYRIMMDIEHRDKIEKDQLLDKIETLYEQSRDISYEKSENLEVNFSDSINVMLTSFSTPTTRILIVGNNENLWAGIQAHIRKELEYILQELMINMSKHSRAKNVVISLKQQKEQIIICYKDDGVGLPPTFEYGNGLKNTGNRIKAISGLISFDSNADKGLKIEISFPANKVE